jgi:hypothetical protein
MGDERTAILHINVLQEAPAFQKRLCAQLACPDEFMVAPLTPGLSFFGGNGLVGVVLVVG